MQHHTCLTRQASDSYTQTDLVHSLRSSYQLKGFSHQFNALPGLFCNKHRMRKLLSVVQTSDGVDVLYAAKITGITVLANRMCRDDTTVFAMEFPTLCSDGTLRSVGGHCMSRVTDMGNKYFLMQPVKAPVFSFNLYRVCATSCHDATGSNSRPGRNIWDAITHTPGKLGCLSSFPGSRSIFYRSLGSPARSAL